MTYAKLLFLFSISSFILLSCKKDEQPDRCPTFQFTDEIIYDSSTEGNTLGQLQEQADGTFYTVLRSGYAGKNNSFARLDSDFNTLDYFAFDYKKIVDFVTLDDGRILISSPHETGHLSILTSDLDSLERLETDYDTAPYFEKLEDGILMTIGSDVYSTKILKLNHELEIQWKVNVGTAKTYSQYYDPESKVLCLPTGYSRVQLIDVNAGKLITTLEHGNLIHGVFFKDGFVYTTGSYGTGGPCGNDVFVRKMDSNGNVMWNVTFGTNDADDAGTSIHVENNYVYVGSTLRDLCTSTFYGYDNFYFTKISDDGEVEECYFEENYQHSRPGDFLKMKNGKLYLNGGYHQTESVNKLIFRGIN